MANPKETINVNVELTPSEAHLRAAAAFYDRLLSDSKQLDNMRHYCREMGRQLPCDVDPHMHNQNVSKDLSMRYGLRYQDNNIVWAILEDWFKSKINDKAVLPQEPYNPDNDNING